GKTASVAEFVKATWKTLIPDLPYEGFSQELILEELLAMGNAASQIFAAIAMIALVLSCMGLFGLVSLHAAKRRKEFSIRKVLGAGFTDLARLISRQFVFILAVALALAIPVSYLALNSLLNMLYVYRVALGPLPFALMAIMIFLVAATTVASRVYQVVTANPVEGLRHE
ncbi:MAG: ABC transporter permease, partial [bacterium]